MESNGRNSTGTGSAQAGQRWVFATARFDESTLELQVSGQPVELERKVVEVLRTLLYRAGEVVTKDELLEAVWPGRIVSESVLAKCVSRLREVLGDDQQAIIKTVHGYGYRLIAPVKAEAVRTLPPQRLGLNPGDHPPLRPLWSLVENLGAGGQGEVWRLRHDKTQESRVLKFALDSSGLAAIKREITLFRYLRDTLGPRPDFVNLLDWNLEEAPYFLELEHVTGGNLETWAQTQGGMVAVPLAQRLEMAARVADVLAAAHSVGVLHKDLKPSNVLVAGSEDGVPAIKLADFGSGGITDPKRLEAMGITRLGFTQTIAANELAATALYLAPEVISGQPATVQADIYALGVMLYQMVVGDLRRPLSPGWELTLDDPLLSEDIASAVAGDPALRLSDAAKLAQRLRTLEARRRERSEQQADRLRLEAEKQAAQEQTRQAELAMARLRARRNWMLAAGATLVLGLVVSLTLYFDARRSRDEAAAAAATSRAVADFLSRDMFAAVSNRPLRDLTLPEFLQSAAKVLPERMQHQPLAAAQVNAALGGAFLTMDMIEDAEPQLDAALQTNRLMGVAYLPQALDAAKQLIHVKYRLRKLPASVPDFEHLLEQSRRELGRSHLAVLSFASNLGQAQGNLGLWPEAIETLNQVIHDARSVQPADTQLIGQALIALGADYYDLGRFQLAATTLEAAIESLGAPDSLPTAAARLGLGRAYAALERFDTAEREILEGIEIFDKWLPPEAQGLRQLVRAPLGELYLRQGRLDEAIVELRKAVGSSDGVNDRSRDEAFLSNSFLAQAYRDAGRLADAQSAIDQAIKGASLLLASSHPTIQSFLLTRTDILRLQGRIPEALKSFKSVDHAALVRLGPQHPLTAESHRLEGLLQLASGLRTDAQQSLRKALNDYMSAYGAEHRLTRRARKELAISE